MGMQRMFNVYCDVRIEDPPYYEQTCLNMVDGSEWYAEEARRVAKAEGWVRKPSRIQKKMVDICPVCWERIQKQALGY